MRKCNYNQLRSTAGGCTLPDMDPEKGRVVSDLLRFEYEKQLPRKRSRNPSPTEIKPPPHLGSSINPNSGFSTRTVHDQDLNLGSSAYEMRDELYDFYAGSSITHDRPTTPYPLAGVPYPSERERTERLYAIERGERLENPPLPPPKDIRSQYGPRNVLAYDNLPPVQDTREYYQEPASQRNLKRNLTGVQNNINYNAFGSSQRDYTPEELLLGKIMNRPLFGSHYANENGGRVYTFTASNIIDFFQIAFGVIITTIASVLASIDDRIDTGLYRYFIAVGVIVLVVALLFVSKSINFERRKGVLYCLLASILTLVALVLSITSIATNNNCLTSQICQLRKVLATFAILSFFLWLCALMMFLTVLYISKMILLNKIDLNNEPMREKRTSMMKEDATLGYMTDTTEVDDHRMSRNYSLAQLPRYYFDENGKMYPLEKNQDLRGTRPMIVYASEGLLT